MIIGTFTTRQDGKIAGTIRTLTLDAKLELVPVEAPKPGAPTFRLYSNRIEVGAAWEKTSQQGTTYWSLSLDDPSFAKPIYTNLVPQNDGKMILLWQRER